MSQTLHLDECAVQKSGFSCFLDSDMYRLLAKLLGYPEHCVYLERVCIC